MSAAFLPYRDAKREFDRDYCERVMEAAHGNISIAARLAQKDRRDFYDLLDRAGVRKKGTTRAKPGTTRGEVP